MPDRQLVYRIIIDTATAKREAGQIRSTFEKELRQISIGKLDTRQLQAGVQNARQLRAEMDQVANASRNAAEKISQIQVPTFGNAVGQLFDSFKLPPALLGGSLVAGGLAIGLAGPILEMAKLGTESIRTEKAFEILSGGANQAQKNLNAIQQASGNTVSSFQAMQIGNQALALGLASTAESFGRLTQAARAVAFVSPVINDIQSAISELGLAAANTSYRRLDQLGLSVGEVRAKMSELRRENETLSDSQAFLEAAVSTLLAKYGPILDSEEARATGLERIATAIADIKNAAAQEITVAINVVTNPAADLIEQYTNNDKLVQKFLSNEDQAYEFLATGIKDADDVQKSYLQSIQETIGLWESGGLKASDYRLRIDSLVEGLLNYQTAQKDVTDTARKAENDRLSSIFEQQLPINQALAARAQKAAPEIGIEQSIATYRQQKAQVEALLQELADSGISDTNEIAIRVAAIVESLTAPFDVLEERAKEAFSIDFSQLGASLTNLDASFVDFLPGIAEARNELANLSAEMMYSGSVTEEQAAQFAYLSSVAYTVADAGSQLNQIVGDLGTEFLESNAYAAELVNQMFLAEAAFHNGQISSGQYAGIMSILSGRLLTVAEAAGIATGAIYALNSAQSDMSNLPGFSAGQGTGGSIADRIQTQQAAAGREQNRREMERYNRDMARAGEQSAKRAGKALEDGAKKASQELKAALDKIPGLFSTTNVTQEDMDAAKGGFYQDKVDEKLRRLRDEVKNGVDWADVSIEDAKASIESIGVDAASTKEGILAQFEQLWNNQALWSNEENIAKWIDEGAVQAAQDLQKKSEEGRNNIYKHFGVIIEDATAAATGGGGGGASIAVKPPQLVDIDPLTEGLQTGLDEYVNASGEVIKEKIANAPSLFFDPANLFGAAKGKTGAMGPMPNPQITITADASAQALTPFLAASGQGTAATPMPMALTPTIDAVAMQTEIDKLTPSVAVQLALTIEEITLFRETVTTLVKPSITPHLSFGATEASEFTVYLQDTIPQPGIVPSLGVTVEEITLFKELVSTLVKPTVQVGLELETQAETDGQQKGAITPLITNLNTQIRGESDAIKREGATVAQIIMAGIIAHFQATNDAEGQQVTTIATNLLTNVTGQLQTMQGTFFATGMMPGQALLDGMASALKGSSGGAASGGEQAATPLADAVLTSLSSQFSAIQNMFYAVGFLPAGSVESGFKGYAYTGLATSFMEKLTTEIRTIGTDLQQRGGTMAGYVQSGFVTSFSSEAFKAQLMAIGELMYSYLEIGILAKVNGGALTNAIAEKVVADIATEIEQP